MAKVAILDECNKLREHGLAHTIPDMAYGVKKIIQVALERHGEPNQFKPDIYGVKEPRKRLKALEYAMKYLPELKQVTHEQ